MFLTTALKRSAASLGARQISQLAHRITDADRAQYDKDGAIIIRKAIGKEWIDTLRAVAEANLVNPGPLCDEHVPKTQPGRFHDDQFLWLRHPDARRFIFDSQAAALVQSVTGSSGVHIFYDQLFVKEPGTSKETQWHTDHSYWQLTGGRVASLWLALDVVPKETVVGRVAPDLTAPAVNQFYSISKSGGALIELTTELTAELTRCSSPSSSATGPASEVGENSGDRATTPPDCLRPARYVAGSHKWELKHRITAFSDSYENADKGRYAASSAFPAVPDVSAMEARGEVEVLRWDCEPGDAIIFDSFAVHGAPGNNSNSTRPGTMHFDWKARGGAALDCGLDGGAKLDCKIHPKVSVAL